MWADDTNSSELGFSEGGDLAPAIHATRLDYSRFELPVAVTVVTQEDIRRHGFLEVSEIFRIVPGFRIVKIGDESRLSYHGTTVRQNRRMKVTIDGKNTLVGDGAYVEFDRLPIDLEDIARVTITRGPNGAAFGDNAFMASIDFTTIGRNDPEGVSMRGGGGSQDRKKYGIAVNKNFNGFQLSLSLGREKDGGYDFSDEMGTPRDDGKEITRGRLTIEREFTPHSQWRLEASAYDSEHAVGRRLLALTGTQSNEGYFFSLSNQRTLDSDTRLDWLISHNHQKERIRTDSCYTPGAIAGSRTIITDPVDQQIVFAPTLFLPGMLGVPLEDVCFFVDLDTESTRTDVEVEFETRRGPLRVLAGGSATLVEAESDQRFPGQDQDQKTIRGFGESDYSFGPLHASLGAMAQNSDNVDSTEFAWRGALNWNVTPTQTFRYAYAHSFRIPSLVESDTSPTATVFFGRRGEPFSTYAFALPLPIKTNATNLDPERIDSHEIGYFGSFLDSRATVDVKVFYEEINDPIRGEDEFFYFSDQPFNSRSFTLQGVEAEGSIRVTERFHLSGQYSFLDNDAEGTFEQGLHGDHASSFAASYRLAKGHTLTAAYYGNSTISGNSYDRYDLVYGFTHLFQGGTALRAQVILQHHKGGRDGIRDPNTFVRDEGFFDDLNQVYVFGEVTF